MFIIGKTEKIGAELVTVFVNNDDSSHSFHLDFSAGNKIDQAYFKPNQMTITLSVWYSF